MRWKKAAPVYGEGGSISIRSRLERVDKGAAVALALIAFVVAAGLGLYLLSRACIEYPATRPFGGSEWKCGMWSGYVAGGMVLVSAAGLALTWRAINRRL